MDNNIQQTLETVKASPIKGFAKTLTLIIIGITYIIGVLGSFDFMNFEMDKFVEFLPVFAYVFVPLLISIGASKIVEKIEDNKTIRATKANAEYHGKPHNATEEA